MQIFCFTAPLPDPPEPVLLSSSRQIIIHVAVAAAIIPPFLSVKAPQQVCFGWRRLLFLNGQEELCNSLTIPQIVNVIWAEQVNQTFFVVRFDGTSKRAVFTLARTPILFYS
jgi:hypothetical protein